MRLVVNPTPIIAVVPLVTPKGDTTAMYVQPKSRAAIPEGHEVKEPYLQQHPRISVVTTA